MLVDAEGHNDWVAELDVDLAASRAAAEPVIRLLRLENLVSQPGGGASLRAGRGPACSG